MTRSGGEEDEWIYELDRGYAKLLGYFPDKYEIVLNEYIFSDGHWVVVVPLKNIDLFCECHKDLVVYGDWRKGYAYERIRRQIKSNLDDMCDQADDFLNHPNISYWPQQYNDSPPNSGRISNPQKPDIIKQYSQKWEYFREFIDNRFEELFWQSLIDHLALDCIETARCLGSRFEGYFLWDERVYKKRRECGFLDDPNYLPSAIIALHKQYDFQMYDPIHSEIEAEKRQERADDFRQETNNICEFGPF